MISIVNWGGGVQSTAIMFLVIEKHPALMKAIPDWMDPPTEFYFADTGDEPEAVYAHVDKMRPILKEGGIDLIEVKRHKEWPLSKHILDRAEAGRNGVSLIPMFVAGGYPLKRGCTQDYKVNPIVRELKKRYGKTDVWEWFGISADESQRMKISQKKHRHFWYPLIEMGWKRDHCIDYLKTKGIESPRSACYFCPFHSPLEWKRIGKKERQKAVDFENKIHAIFDKKGITVLKNKPYLHRSMQPLEAIDFDSQMDLFYDPMDDECFGVCGV